MAHLRGRRQDRHAVVDDHEPSLEGVYNYGDSGSTACDLFGNSVRGGPYVLVWCGQMYGVRAGLTDLPEGWPEIVGRVHRRWRRWS